MKLIRSFKQIKLGESDEEKRAIIEQYQYRWALIIDNHAGEDRRMIGTIKPNDFGTYYFKPTSESENAEIKRFHYHDLLELSLAENNSELQNF